MAEETCTANVLEISPMMSHQQDQQPMVSKSRDQVRMHGEAATTKNNEDASRLQTSGVDPSTQSQPIKDGETMDKKAKVIGTLFKDQPSTHKKGLVKIDDKQSDWYQALFFSDCKSLMKLLKENPLLVGFTGHEERNVLHAAARRGCVPLVDQIMSLFKDSSGQFIVTDHDRVLLLQDLFQEKDAKTKLRAVEIMEYFMGNRCLRKHMKDYLQNALSRLYSIGGAKHVADGKVPANQSEIKEATVFNVDSKSSSSTSPSNATVQNDSHVDGKPRMDLRFFFDALKNGRVYELVTEGGIGQLLTAPLRLFKKSHKGIVGQSESEKSKTMQNEDDPNPKVLACDAKVEKIRSVITPLLADERFIHLNEKYLKDKNYNFDEGHDEFAFHYACRTVALESSAQPFIELCMTECLNLQGGDEVLQYLYELCNWQGNTPCHAALAGSGQGLEILLNLLPKEPRSSLDFMNACDARGWTPLHKVVAMGGTGSWKYRRLLWLLLNDTRTKVEKKLRKSDITPLHLAIFHNLPKVVEMLIWSDKDIGINALLRRKIKYTSTMSKPSSYWWSPLQLAAIMGKPDVVEILLTKIKNIYEVSKRNNEGVAQGNYDNDIPALHMAAASGNPEVLRLFLDNSYRTFDPTKFTAQKRTSLHCAVDATAPSMVDKQIVEANKFIDPSLCVLDFGDVYHLEHVIRAYNEAMKSKESADPYEGRKTCITMLLQDGVDLWQRDNEDRFAEPGPEATLPTRLWWFDLKAKETLPVKKILNDAANATSVVATLIATASYVGPLQPPLGYGTSASSPSFDLVQTTYEDVQIFVVTNCLAFYLAIGSIMFAIVPNVPTPHQGIFEEWQRSRKIVGIAITLLLMSVINILISFAAASNVGMSEHFSMKHLGLAFYPAMLGGFFCLLGSFVYFIDFQRFIQSFGIGIKKGSISYKRPSTYIGRR